MSSTTIIIEPAVFIEGDELTIRDLHVTDPVVVSLVAESENEEAVVLDCLGVGARALRATGVTQDSAIVEHAFQDMKAAFDRDVEAAAERIVAAAEGLLDEEDGSLHLTLNGWREELDRHLGEAFNPDSRKSIIGKFEELLERARRDHVEAVRMVISPDREDGPLARVRADIVKAVNDQVGLVLRGVTELAEKVAVKGAQAQALELSSTKGFSYEDTVHHVIGVIAAAYGDVAERVGTTTGALATKAGDELVTLNPEDTRGEHARYVLELKDRKLGVNAILNELEAAMENREALAGIAVFSRDELSPIAAPFQHFGAKAIVTLDKDELDERALRLACMWARWVVRRQLGDADGELDLDRVESLVADAKRALARATTVRKAHSSAKRKIDEAAGQVDELVEDVDRALVALCSSIGRS
jgi:hypothetical protein